MRVVLLLLWPPCHELVHPAQDQRRHIQGSRYQGKGCLPQAQRARQALQHGPRRAQGRPAQDGRHWRVLQGCMWTRGGGGSGGGGR